MGSPQDGATAGKSASAASAASPQPPGMMPYPDWSAYYASGVAPPGAFYPPGAWGGQGFAAMDGPESAGDDKSFADNFSGEGAERLKDSVKEKLKEFLEDYSDGTLVSAVCVSSGSGFPQIETLAMRVDGKRVLPDCINASHPYYECVGYCSQRIAADKARAAAKLAVEEPMVEVPVAVAAADGVEEIGAVPGAAEERSGARDEVGKFGPVEGVRDDVDDDGVTERDVKGAASGENLVEGAKSHTSAEDSDPADSGEVGNDGGTGFDRGVEESTLH